MGSFQQGQRVKFLNDVGSATVVRVEGEQVVVEDEDGFERTVGIRELMAAPDPEQEAKSYGDNVPDLAKLLVQEVGEKRMRSLQKEFEVKYHNSKATNMARRDAHMEVDLHIHELVDDQSGLPDRAKLALQMEHFDRMMDIAKAREAPADCVHPRRGPRRLASRNPHEPGATSSGLLAPSGGPAALWVWGNGGLAGPRGLAQAGVRIGKLSGCGGGDASWGLGTPGFGRLPGWPPQCSSGSANVRFSRSSRCS